MKMPSSSAQDRQVSVWFQKITNGEIKLPRFQRHQAWDKNRVCSLLKTITQNLPLGVTLLLEVDQEQFVSRYLATAPETGGRVTEHLLDGQQRLTALWRTLHNNYEGLKFFLYLSQYNHNGTANDDSSDSDVWCITRWKNKHGKTMPLWADKPEECFSRGLIPMEFLRPVDTSTEYDSWIDQAIIDQKPTSGSENFEQDFEKWIGIKSDLRNIIRDFRETISHFNLPYLALPSHTDKDTALKVFINMNTSSKPLSQYDIIRAEIEGVKGVSLDDYQQALHTSYPEIHYYFELPYLILATSALIQDKQPNQRGMWDMHKDVMIENWDKMSLGLSKMACFLKSQGVYDRDRLPTNAVLAVIAALYTYIPENLDARGKWEILLKKYLWSSFFTDRYENSAASSAYADFTAIKNVIIGKNKNEETLYIEQDVPVLNREKYPLVTAEELLRVGWPKRENIRARAIMTVFSKLGAYDFADGSQLTRQQLVDGKRHYHHVFPDALLKEAGVESYLALNCSMITDKTNLNISNKEPLRYLKERYEWTSEEIVNSRLESHLIPLEELRNGGYENLSPEAASVKITSDFSAFILKRAQYVVKAVEQLLAGKDISAREVIQLSNEQTEEVAEA